MMGNWEVVGSDLVTTEIWVEISAPHAPLALSYVECTDHLTVSEMLRERTTHHLPSYAEAEKMKSSLGTDRVDIFFQVPNPSISMYYLLVPSKKLSAIYLYAKSYSYF